MPALHLAATGFAWQPLVTPGRHRPMLLDDVVREIYAPRHPRLTRMFLKLTTCPG
jgi:hypothetical protein